MKTFEHGGKHRCWGRRMCQTKTKHSSLEERESALKTRCMLGHLLRRKDLSKIWNCSVAAANWIVSQKHHKIKMRCIKKSLCDAHFVRRTSIVFDLFPSCSWLYAKKVPKTHIQASQCCSRDWKSLNSKHIVCLTFFSQGSSSLIIILHLFCLLERASWNVLKSGNTAVFVLLLYFGAF